MLSEIEKIITEDVPVVKDPTSSNKPTQTFSGANMRNFKEIENNINSLIQDSPFEGQLKDYSGVNVNIGLSIDGDPSKDITISLEGMSISHGTLYCNINTYNGISMDKFSAGVRTKSGVVAQKEDIKISDVVKNSDADYLFTLSYPKVKKNIENTLPIYIETLASLKQIRKNSRSLAVGWHKGIEQFVLQYNPNFILSSAITDYLYDKSNNNTFSDFEDCYVYGLTFMIVHELEHIVRNHVVSKNTTSLLDKVSNDQTGWGLANGLTDTFINTNIRGLLNRGLNKPDSTGVICGYGNEVFIASTPIVNAVTSGAKGIYQAVPLGFGSFKRVGQLSDIVLDVFRNVVKFDGGDDIRNNATEVDLSIYDSQPFILMFACSDLHQVFGKNSTLYNNFFVSILKKLTKPVTFDNTGSLNYKTKVIKSEEPAPKKGEKIVIDADLVGQIVKDKITGKRGYIVEYDPESGTVDVIYPKDQSSITDILGY